MALSIKNPQAERLAAEVSRLTGETLTDAVIQALAERLERLTARRARPNLEQRLTEIAQRCGRLPDLDSRTPEEILGYDDRGTFER